MSRSSTGPWLRLLLLVAALAGFAWLTRHPDAPIVARAEEWPVVGGLAARFREAYLGPEEGSPGASSGVSSGAIGTAGEEVASSSSGVVFVPADPDEVGARPRVWVPEGTAVRAEPRPASRAWVTTTATANLPWLERRGEWFRVRIRGREGWVHLPGPRKSLEPPLGREAVPPGPLPGREADPERLAVARALMREERTATLGPYPLYTDLDAGPFLERLDRIATGVESAYRLRYGVDPVGHPREAIVLYRLQADYRAFQAGEEEVADLPATGHTGGGLVALHAAGPGSEIESTLVHELAHLLNRRAVGPALPPWLDEGLADDLAHGRITDGGRLLPERLGGETVPIGGHRVERHGGIAAAIFVDTAFGTGRQVPLPDLLAMDHESFVRSDDRQLHYAESALFIRFLLSSGDPALADAFRRFLRGVAAGGPPSPGALGAALGVDWRPLEMRFRAWLRLAASG